MTNPQPVWQDTGVNARVIGANGRYEVRYPLISSETGVPDFTTHLDAVSYAEHVAKTMRFTRNVAHGVALRENERRGPSMFTLDLVLVDAVGDVWVLIGPDRYKLSVNLKGTWSSTGGKEYIEKHFGPVTVEHSIQIKGEVLS